MNKRSKYDHDQFEFLNELGQLTDWNDPSKSKLWLYNLHYFDDLNSIDAEDRYDLHETLIDRWIDQNSPGIGNGWEPYPTSLRIVNWIKWFAATSRVTKKRSGSLALQAKVLSQTLETHLLGNHLFANAKALLFAGLYFSGEDTDQWVKTALEIFDKELSEQILPDGGNFELSPMYHAIIIADVLDMVSIMACYQDARCDAFLNKCKELLPKMLGWLDAVSHPDGNISFFNDAAVGVAPALSLLVEAASLFNLNTAGSCLDTVSYLPDSGYFRLNLNDGVLIGDVARVGPDYIPGHAHADTLSFELSIFGHRLIVNSGTSCYGESDERLRQRGTAAHSTVVVDGDDSSEVWGGFRVARRAFPIELHIDQDGRYVTCSHDGYHRLRGKPTHTRRWLYTDRSISVHDLVSGEHNSAEARYHIHPNWVCEFDAKQFVHVESGKRVCFEVIYGTPTLEPSTYHPEFGKTIDNSVLVVALQDGQSKISLYW